MTCAQCKKAIKGWAELLYVTSDSNEWGLHRRCEAEYEGGHQGGQSRIDRTTEETGG